MAWILLVLCGVILAPTVQGYYTTEGYYTTTEGYYTTEGQITTTEGQITTTDVQTSCRYNCGNDMGRCSCTSNCQYYGNCCHDYYSYCPSTTIESRSTTAQPSCRYNCGYSMGHCSCNYDCQYYGNCCRDYYSYCPSTTTPEKPSCRYNCGYNMGSCSCTSSCQYYGNCCRDFQSYCPSTTNEPKTTSAQPSCRYNCGYNMGSCSCTSSCQNNGNCCHDYYSQCQMNTLPPPGPTAQSCGGSLHGSGTFSSRNYPNHYPDRENCVWQLSAPYNQRLSLTITDLQLETCCTCDYIQIYDGSSVYSQSLGKLCNSNTTGSSFYSSSNYMTVVFRTDGSYVARGFNAEFKSVLPSSSGRVECSSDNMVIVVGRSYLNSIGYDGHSLYLNDQHCRPQISSYEVVFSFPINTCGTQRKFENGRVLYSNAIRAYTSYYGEITRQSHFTINVGCLMEQDTMVQQMYIASSNPNSSISGTGRFNGTMAFYTSSSFYTMVTQVPYKVTLNQQLYVQIKLRRDDSSLMLFVDTCVASPSPHDFHTRAYDLVRNGCGMDSSYKDYGSGTTFARFSFRAFQFVRAHESVYLQCKVVICQASDYNSRCRRGCVKRRTRDLGSDHEIHTLVLGPIQLNDLEGQDKDTPEEEVKEEEVKA